MSVTYDAHASGEINGNPLSFAHVCGADATILLVGAADEDQIAALSVTYNAVGLTRIQHYGDLTAWVLYDPPAGSHTVTINFNGSRRHAGWSLSLNGSKLEEAISDIQTTSAGGSSSFSDTVASTPSSLVVSGMGCHAAIINDNSVSPTGGETEFADRAQGGGGDDVHIWGAYQAGSASTSTSATFSSRTWYSICFSVDAPPATGVTPRNVMIFNKIQSFYKDLRLGMIPAWDIQRRYKEAYA